MSPYQRNRLSRALLLLAMALTFAGCEVVEAPAPVTLSAATPTGDRSAPSISALTPTPMPLTVPPAPVLLSRAMDARAIGEDAAAGADLDALLHAYPDAAEARPARLYLAESLALRNNWTAAVDLLRPFVDAPVDDALRAPAIFWLARGYESAGDHAAAIAAYQRYRDLGTPLEPYAAMRQAAQYEAAGQLAEAAVAYEYVARADIVRGERAGSFERAIALRRRMGQAGAGIALYTELLTLADIPAYRARILSEASALAHDLGQTEQATLWLRQIISDAPDTPEAATAADQLLAAGDPALTAAAAGRIFFDNERWTDTITQLDAAIAQGGDAGVELRRLRGLALRAQGNFPAALDALAKAGALSPNSEAGRQAQLDWIQTLGQSGEIDRASQAYQEYATTYANDSRAPEAISRAAELRERLGDGAGANTLRLDLSHRYPQSDQVAAAIRRVGLDLFGAGRYAEAESVWQILADVRVGDLQAQGAFWAGRSVSAQGDKTRAADLFRRALAASPTSYYGARAAEELGGVAEGTLALETPLGDADWESLRSWVHSWPGQGTDVGDVGVEADGFVRRANLLADVGLSNESRNEWMAAADRWEKDAPRLTELARLAYAKGATSIALRSAARLARLAPAESPSPQVLDRLLYPAPYPRLVAQQSAERSLDPRLLYALMRQESLFDPQATSWVGARGLGQVMPETGQGIAQNLGVANFSVDDLYRPAVSVRFAAFYLKERIDDMHGSVQAALSAYNGGLGNAQRWAGGSSVADPDLFTEGVDFAETRGYIKAVYGFYATYRRLYQ
ncbi:MAG: transglycosylase SLT domain-containing protein [Chloroflexales bacterium]